MLASIVVQLKAIQGGKLQNGNAGGVHGLMYRHLQKIQPQMSEWLHANRQPFKPYTVSPLMGLPPEKKGVISYDCGQHAWFRITSLCEALTGVFLEERGWLASLPEMLEIDRTHWQVTGKTADAGQHPMARQLTYERLRDDVFSSLPPPERWKLRFLSPVTLNGERFTFPFPLPDRLVESWLKRWNVFAPFVIDEELCEMSRRFLAVQEYRLRTTLVRERHHPLCGCLGEISYRAYQMPAEARAALSLLIEYSFFCGSGYKTPQGMGQTCPVRNGERHG